MTRLEEANSIKRFLKLLAGMFVAFPGCGTQPGHVPTTAQQVGGDAELNELLLQLLDAHGVAANIEADWIVIADRCRVAACVARDVPAPEGTFNLQLDFYVDLPDGRLLAESFAGIGATKEDAVKDGFHNFTANSFHVLMTAFIDPSNAEQVYTERWTIKGHEREVVIGNMGIRRFTDGEFNPPTEWFGEIQKEIESLPLDNKCHWIRCYYAQMDGKPMAVEALLDNNESSTLKATMENIEWPAESEFYGLRVFLVVREHQ